MTDAILLSIAVDRSSTRPLFQQVYDDLRERILSGALRPNSQLPPTRLFADELGLSRSTVTAAYDQLVSEGYATGRQGSGIFVCELPENALQTPAVRNKTAPTSRRPASRSPRPFKQGVPDMRLFPYENWAKTIARVSRSTPRSLILSDDAFGDYDLRLSLADHLAEWRGFATSADQIMITAGAAGALEVIFRALTQRNDRVALEDPGYPPMRRIAESMGLQPVWMPVGTHGANPKHLPPPNPSPANASEEKEFTGTPPKLIVLTPSHQFPLGGAMPLGRRLDFLDYAEQTQAYIVEDDFDSEFRYAGRPIPAMAGMKASLKDSSRVLYVGSFSKVFAANLRLGYLVVPEDLIDLFRETLEAYGVVASIMPQRPLAEFVRSGEFHRHIRRMRRIYGTRRRDFFQLVDHYLGDRVSYQDHQAGMTVLLKLSDKFDDLAVADEAARQGVILQPASEFYAPVKGKDNQARSGQSGLLAGFSAFEPEEMLRPMEILSRLLDQY